jgi:CDP-paratose 2-epimerase
MTAGLTGKKQQYRYIDENRLGDHIVYISDLRKMKAHYPGWDITKSLKQILCEIIDAWGQRLTNG